ncbi:acyltransferase family protein, partial [Pimelobacter simplex]
MTTAVSEEVSPRPYRWDLDVLRIMAILGVLAIHIFGLILGEEQLRGTSTWYFGLIIDLGSTWCVPVFVMISGALLLDPRAHVGGPGIFLRKRALRLVPALVVWHLVYLLLV